MKKFFLLTTLVYCILFHFDNKQLYAQCNTNTSICTPGTAGPFNFVTPGTPVSTCLDWFGPNTGYIILYITQSGPLNMLINGNSGTGFLDVSVFNIPTGQAPCTAIQNNANQIGCNYASSSSGCNQFGNAFPCTSSVPAPNVTAGQVLMIVVENWSGSSSNFTLQLGPPPGAQTGPPNPAINPAGPFCSTGGTVQLTAVNNGGTWSGPGTSSTGIFNPATAGPGNHTINYSIGTAPCNASSSTTITVNAPGPITVNPNPASICAGGNVSLTASGATGYAWSPATGLSSTSGATVTASPSATTTYTVSSSPAGCKTPANVTVTVNPLPAASAGPNQTITCGTPTATLNGSPAGMNYSWSGPGIVGANNTQNITANAAGTYTLTVTNPTTGCSATSTVTVTGNTTVPIASAGTGSTLTCATTSVTLNGSGSTSGMNYSWSGPGITGSTTTQNTTANAPGTYTLTVTHPTSGCTATSTVNITQNNTPPNASAGPAQVLTCTNPTRTLTGSSSTGGVTYSWSGPGIVSGGNTATPTVNQAGTYTLTVTNPANGCTATSTVNVTLNNTPPNANAGTAQVLTCSVTSVVLNGSSSTGGVSFSWSGPGIVSGGNTATPTVNQAGTYTLTVTNPANGCTATSTVNVTLNNTPPNANAGTAQVLTCSATSVVLNGSSSTGGVSFSWSGPGIVSGGNTATPTVNQAGTYTLTVTNPANGCTATSTVNVTLNNTPPNANAGTAQVLTCSVTSVVLNGSSSTGGVTFSWSGPGIVSGGNTATPTVNQPGTYTLTVTNPSNGCTATSTVSVTQTVAPPNANAGAGQLLNCTTTSVVLNGSSSTGGVTFSWTGPGIVSGGSTSTPTVNQAGTYTLTVTDPSNGCSNTSTVNVTQNITPPNANAGTAQTLTCATLDATLNGSSSTSGAAFSWSGPGIVSGGNTTAPIVNQPGTYTLTVTDPTNGCVNTSNVNVVQNITPPNANAGPNQVLSCAVTSINLNGSSSTPGVTFSWTGPGIVSGANTATPSVNQAGTYTLTVTNPTNGCTSTSNTTVTNDVGTPNVNAGSSQVLNCTTTSVVLNGSSSTGGVTFSWSGPGIVSGGSTATPTINQPGTYTLTVTDPSNGCTNTANVSITQNTIVPDINAGSPQELTCSTTDVLLNGSSSTSGISYSWSGPGIVSGGNSAAPTVNQPGTYSLTVTDPANGCTATSTVNVTQNITPPNANAGSTQELTCATTSVNLNGSSSTGGVNFSWSGPGIVSGGNSATPTVNQPGSYTLTVTDPANGCTATSTVNITQNITPPNANAGPNQVLTCAVTSINLNGSSSTPGVTFSWTGPGIVSGGNTATPTVNMAGTYTLTVTNPANGCTTSATTTVTNDLGVPNANAGADQVLNCVVTDVVLNGSSSTAGVNYSWSGPGIVSGGNTATPTVDQAGTYTLTVADPSNGCTNTSNVDVTQNIIQPNANAGTAQELNCSNTTVILNGSSTTSGVSFSWVGPGIISGGSSAAPTVDQPGTYTLTVTDPSNGCTNNSTVTITQNITLPNVNAGSAQTLTCTTTTVNLNGSSSTSGVTFAWTGSGIVSGGNTATPTVNQPGNYTLTVTDPTNGCTSNSSVNIAQDLVAPDANAGASQVLSCAVTSVNLNGSTTTSGGLFSWTGPGIVSGGNTASPSVNQAGNYVLTVTDPTNGCTSTDNTNVTNDIGVPNANAGSPGILNCAVTDLILNGSSTTSGVNYSWSGPGIVSGSNSANPTINQPGTYTLTVTDPSNGCSSIASVMITQDITIPDANAGATQQLTCLTTNVILNGSSSTSGVNYSWTGPGIVSGGNTATPSVDQPGMYTLTVTNPANGCSNSASVNISQDIAAPLNNFIADSLYGCGSLPVNFTEINNQVGMIYEWDFGNGSTSSAGSTVSNFYNQAGCYDVSLNVIDPTNGCSTFASYPALVCVIAQPIASFSTNPNQLETINSAVTMNNTSSNATDYQWDFGDETVGSSMVNPIHDYDEQIGNYTIQLVASNQNLCFDTAYAQIKLIESLVFYIPNTFTPDGDSYNEEFKPVFYSGFDPYNYTMLIFNRWGEIIWESHNYDIGWNGTYNGNLVSDGTYTWRIEVKTNQTDERKLYVGHVNIIK